ncbi:MAG: chemotaxis-specific protein-glutamate methyltransferase CheB [Proteobacteria bacterium]|nr:MAG: chemotaxis-specific protein-glutamate methyltransferase CheB [Pseudomonadota bacterium]
MKKIRVMIVEDSLVIRTYLEHIIGKDARLDLVASFSTAEDALKGIVKAAPDVISLDIRLPGMNGLEATLRIMSEHPTPIVVLAANVDSDELNISMNALRAGALTVLEKPAGVNGKDYEIIAARICDQLVAMSVVKVVRQRTARTLNLNGSKEIIHSNVFKMANPPVARSDRFRVMGLVASTGGPNAIVAVLSRLPREFPLPILLVQHITPSFLESFGSWLQGLCPFKVVIVKGGEFPVAGTVYMAPVDHHIILESGRISIHQGPLVSMQRPAGTVLFQSMAKTLGPRALAVLLTGMGEDGATGMKEIYDAGGYTIAEDESTCVVYGMPAAAVRLGGVSELLPLDIIAERLQQIVAPQLGGLNVG